MRKLYDFQSVWMDEKEIVHKLIGYNKEGWPNLSHFHNVLTDPVEYEYWQEYKGFYFFENILRSELQLSRNGKPGDIDIMIIPYSKINVFFERTAVIEAKVVRPTRSRPKKNANSLGETQIYGLIEDGFPVIGVLHICMPEALLYDEMQVLRVAKFSIGDNIIPDSGNGNYDLDDPENYEEVKMDWFGAFAAKNQMKRLISLGLPKYIGMQAIGAGFDADGSLITTDVAFYGFKGAYFNPKMSSDTISKIQEYFIKNRHKARVLDMKRKPNNDLKNE